MVFHLGLYYLVAIDLKIGEFNQNMLVKMNYYLSLLDRLERREDENHLLAHTMSWKRLCWSQLALEEMDKPIGIADYQLIVTLEELKRIVAEEVEAFG